MDHAFAERGDPLLHGFEARIEDADSLVAEVEQVRIEERQFVVGRVLAGHASARAGTHADRRVLVLDTHAPAERGRGKGRDLPGRVAVGIGTAQVVVDHDAVVDFEAGVLRELHVGGNAEPRDHDLRFDRRAVGQPEAVAFAALDLDAGAHVDTLFAVVRGHRVGERLRVDPGGNRIFRKQHRDLAIVHRHGRSYLAADEAATDHRDAGAGLYRLAQPLVVVEGTVVDEIVAPGGEPPRGAAGGDQELAVLPGVAGVVMHHVRRAVDPGRTAPQGNGGACLVDRTPDVLFLAILPELLGERRAIVGRMGFVADQADRRAGVGLAQRLRGGLAGHSGTDDEVVEIVFHGALRPGGACARGTSRILAALR